VIKNNIYEITWNDHYSTDGFFAHQEIDIVEEIVFKSVGYFIKEDKKHYHLARTKGDEEYADIMSILKKSTLHIQEF
jgi:hypothetical protein